MEIFSLVQALLFGNCGCNNPRSGASKLPKIGQGHCSHFAHGWHVTLQCKSLGILKCTECRLKERLCAVHVTTTKNDYRSYTYRMVTASPYVSPSIPSSLSVMLMVSLNTASMKDLPS